jgi:hypothetical protein
MSELMKKNPGDYINNRTLHVVLIFLSTFLFILGFSNKFFFWDTITEVSIPANFYYDNNFQLSFFNESKAIGHQTAIPLYLAAVWKIFGRSLVISHLAFFPFVFGILYLIYRYIRRSGVTIPMLILILLLVILDPALLSQTSLMTFDIPQIFFFLLCIVSYSERKDLLLLIAFTGLCLTNLRGVFCGFGIIIYYILDVYSAKERISGRKLLLFLPGIVSFFVFFWLFLNSKQWSIWDLIVYLWNGPSEFTSYGRIFKNTGIFGWRLIDYGRIGMISVFGFIIYRAVRLRSLYDDFLRQTFLVAVSQFVVFFPVTVIFTKFIGHRYIIPVIIPLAICTGYWILKYSRFPKALFTVVAGILLSGYFWIYPDSIAQGWDATPAHWPYYEVRTRMISYLEKESIKVTEVGSFFPNLASFKDTDLQNDYSSFKVTDLGSDKYVLYSNVFNIPDEKREILANQEIWTIMHKIKKRGVYMILYKRKDE